MGRLDASLDDSRAVGCEGPPTTAHGQGDELNIHGRLGAYWRRCAPSMGAGACAAIHTTQPSRFPGPKSFLAGSHSSHLVLAACVLRRFSGSGLRATLEPMVL